MDIRENGQDLEEVIRTAVAGLMKNYWHAMPARVSEDSKDGHVATVQPTIKRALTSPVDGSVTYEDHPLHPDAPIHHMGGGGISTTHPTSKDDTGTIIYASRAIDSWVQSDGTQNPIDDRLHDLGDAMFMSGVRSIPRMLQQVSQASAQTRTDDKKSVIDHGPNGTHHKTVDPSTQAASANFDPFMSATKFFEHILHPTNGHAVNATDGGTTHGSSITHDAGFMAQANNGAHSVAAHPTNGVGIKSSVAHTIDAPNASLDSGGKMTAQSDIKSTSGNISAPAGGISGLTGGFGAITGLGGGAIGLIKALAASLGSIAAGSMQATGAVQAASIQAMGNVQGDTIQTDMVYTVASLNTAYPPAAAVAGMRAYVSDASSPTWNQQLAGGGSQGCSAICVGGPAGDGSGSSFMWVAG